MVHAFTASVSEQVWKFSVVDVIRAIVGDDRARRYWNDLKVKLVQDEGFTELSEKIGQLRLEAQDGAMRLTDVAMRNGLDDTKYRLQPWESVLRTGK
jgi:hypothetical protein